MASDSRSPRPKISDANRAFAARLLQACENHPHCPTDTPRGKQKWVREKLLELGIKVSAEGVRRWFDGTSLPNKNKRGVYLCRILNVDAAWLYFNDAEAISPDDVLVRNAVAEGATNLFAGMLQMAGASIAFSEDSRSIIETITGGRKFTFVVVNPIPLGEDLYRFKVTNDLDGRIVVVIFENAPYNYSPLVMLPEHIRQTGILRGDKWDVTIHRSSPNAVATGDRGWDISKMLEALGAQLP